MANLPQGNGWSKWQEHVLAELKRYGVWMGNMDKSITHIKVKVGKLQVKAGVWGIIGGMVPVTIIVVLWLIKEYGQ